MRYCIAFVLLLIALTNHAQQFGATPAAVKWKQIDTDTARIIFPTGLEKQAQRAATIIHAMQANHASTIGDSLKKVSIVLNAYTSYSNGYVQLAPFRSEFYLTAPQDAFELGAQSWVDNLAIHEYRHVQQYNNFNKGLSNFASIILGQEGRAVANAAAIPDWFFEGDAVFNETKLSQQGRGKLPAFFNGYKALSMGRIKYSFMKLRNGSYKNFVPDHYPLGYMLVAYGYDKYGADFWKKVTNDAVRFKPLFYPMQGAIKKYAGISYNEFCKTALGFYEQKFWLQPSVPTEMQPTHYTTISKQSVSVIDYLYPYSINDSLLIVLKKGYNQIPTFIKLGLNGTEEKIAVRDIAYDDYFSYKNGKIVFATYKPDIRWNYKEYSILKVLDIHTKKEKTITTKSRLFSPDITNDGQLVIAIEMTPEGKSDLVLMDIHGNKMMSWSSKDGEIYSYPKFSANEKFVYVCTRKPNGDMALQKFALIDSTVSAFKTLVPFSNKIIGFPVIKGDTILLTMSNIEKVVDVRPSTYMDSNFNAGTDGVFAFIEKQQQLYLLFDFYMGLYQSVLTSDNSLIFTMFTHEGYKPLLRKPFAYQWTKFDIKSDELKDLYVTKTFNQANHQFLSTLAARNFETKKYRKATGLLNFHSWRPYYDSPEISFTVYGENVLNTFQSELAYTYDRNEGSSKVGYTGIYGATYVQPFFNISQTWQRSALYNPTTRVYWNEFNANAGLQLPFNFSGGKQYRYLTLSSAFNTSQIKWTGIAKGALQDYTINYLTTRLQYSSQSQKAVQHIFPHWAQSFSVQYKNIINKYTANQLLVNAALYLPGIGTNHSLVITGAYQSRDTANQYYFTNNFPFSKGYRSVDFPRMYKLGGNYHIPLAYPDFGFANIVYFLRVRANAFYEYTQTKSLRTGNTFNFSTAGMEIYFDTKWWNQQAVSFGIRYSRLLDNEYSGATQPNQWQFILPVNLFR